MSSPTKFSLFHHRFLESFCGGKIDPRFWLIVSHFFNINIFRKIFSILSLFSTKMALKAASLLNLEIVSKQKTF